MGLFFVPILAVFARYTCTMNAVQTLQSRNSFKIEDIYVNQILTETGEDIFTEQARVAAGQLEDLSDIIGGSSFAVSNGELSIKHILRQRLIDIKRPNLIRQKPIRIHNTLVYAAFNRLAGKVRFGYTNAAKNIIAQEYNIEI